MSYLLSKDRDYSIDPERPYSLSEAGQKLGVSADTVRRMIDEKELSAYQVRTKWLVRGKELIRYMKDHGYEY